MVPCPRVRMCIGSWKETQESLYIHRGRIEWGCGTNPKRLEQQRTHLGRKECRSCQGSSLLQVLLLDEVSVAWLLSVQEVPGKAPSPLPISWMRSWNTNVLALRRVTKVSKSVTNLLTGEEMDHHITSPLSNSLSTTESSAGTYNISLRTVVHPSLVREQVWNQSYGNDFTLHMCVCAILWASIEMHIFQRSLQLICVGYVAWSLEMHSVGKLMPSSYSLPLMGTLLLPDTEA